MAGLLAANMLRRREPIVIERQASLPNNHEALLRFRTDKVSKATGIPFRKVEVSKGICFNGKVHNECRLDWNNMYSYKVTRQYSARSIGDLRTCERYIAPPDFISQMARKCSIRYGADVVVVPSMLETGNCGDSPIISTIPMPSLMLMAGREVPHFPSRSVGSVRLRIVNAPCELYQTLYYPDCRLPHYRASITGDVLIIEFQHGISDMANGGWRTYVDQILEDFGIAGHNLVPVSPYREHKLGKIMPLKDDAVRRQFITQMTDAYAIYSLGRFATWRQILLDDLVKDIEYIDRAITDRTGYSHRLI